MHNWIPKLPWTSNGYVLLLPTFFGVSMILPHHYILHCSVSGKDNFYFCSHIFRFRESSGNIFLVLEQEKLNREATTEKLPMRKPLLSEPDSHATNLGFVLVLVWGDFA